MGQVEHSAVQGKAGGGQERNFYNRGMRSLLVLPPQTTQHIFKREWRSKKGDEEMSFPIRYQVIQSIHSFLVLALLTFENIVQFENSRLPVFPISHNATCFVLEFHKRGKGRVAGRGVERKKIGTFVRDRNIDGRAEEVASTQASFF